MMLAVITYAYLMAVLDANPCHSEAKPVPEENKTIVYKCVPKDNKVPELLANPFKLPPQVDKEDKE